MLVSIRYNFRNPAAWARPSSWLYRHALDQIAWADTAGFDRVTFPEHHFLEEGFLPSLMPICAAVAARTRNMVIGTEILLLPLHHPVRLAEDAAIVDIISEGRLELTVAAGYRKEEYAGMGLRLGERVGRMEECLQILRKCWTEDRFSFAGKYYRLRDVSVFPKPVQARGPRLILGGSSPSVAVRAARYADGMQPMDPTLWDIYHAELERLGRPLPRQPVPQRRPPFLHVCEDPERDWEILRPHAQYEVSQYAAWGMAGAATYGDLGSDDHLLRQSHAVWTPEEALSYLRSQQAEFPGSTFSFAPILAGMDPDMAQASLELIASRILPVLKQDMATHDLQSR